LSRHADLSESERKDKVRELLSRVDMSEGDFAKMPSEISGGMQKRVGLARPYQIGPDFLLQTQSVQHIYLCSVRQHESIEQRHG
jgi:ABC-type transporter Mla maintaining outer membrane lipid asymmetry ATPase subunit MlaF